MSTERVSLLELSPLRPPARRRRHRHRRGLPGGPDRAGHGREGGRRDPPGAVREGADQSADGVAPRAAPRLTSRGSWLMPLMSRTTVRGPPNSDASWRRLAGRATIRRWPSSALLALDEQALVELDGFRGAAQHPASCTSPNSRQDAAMAYLLANSTVRAVTTLPLGSSSPLSSKTLPTPEQAPALLRVGRHDVREPGSLADGHRVWWKHMTHLHVGCDECLIGVSSPPHT